MVFICREERGIAIKKKKKRGINQSFKPSLYYKDRKQLNIFLTQIGPTVPLTLDPPVRVERGGGGLPIEIESWRAFLPKRNIFSHRIVFLPALRTWRSSVCRSSPSRAGRSTPRSSPTATLASGGPDIHHTRLPTPVSVIPRRLLQFSDPLLGASLRPHRRPWKSSSASL